MRFILAAHTFLNVSSDAWTAIGTWSLVAVGVGAAFYARSQLREARQLRREQSQPYVAVYTDESGGSSPQNLDLVVKNFGATVATDVRVTITPRPQSVVLGDSGTGELFDIALPEVIPVLVPGQEWRAFWDFAPSRCDKSNTNTLRTDIAQRHEASVTFRDSHHRPVEGEWKFVLDWHVFMARSYVNVYGLHEIAEATQKIGRVLWDSRGNQNAIRIESRDGDALDSWKLHLRRERGRKGRIEHGGASREDRLIQAIEARWKRLKRRVGR